MSMTMLIIGSLAVTLAQTPAEQTQPAPPTTPIASTEASTPAAAAPIEPARETDLEFALTAGVWLPRLGGDAKLGPSPAADDINLGDDFHLDDTDVAANFEMYLRKGERWQIDFSGFNFSTDASGALEFAGAWGDLAFAPGDSYSADFDMSSLALSVSCWQWHPIPREGKDGPLDLRFAWGFGVRYLDVDQELELTATGESDSGDGAWMIPELILQMNIHYDLDPSFPVFDAFEVIGWISAGPAIGGDGGSAVTLRAGIRGWIGHNFSIDFGYRLLEASVENDEYELEGGLQGLFVGGSLRF